MTIATHSEPLRTWPANNDFAELEDLEILNPDELDRLVIGDGTLLEITAMAKVHFEGPGVPTGEQAPYLVAGETGLLPPADLWEEYFGTYERHVLRLAAQFTRGLGHQAFVIYYYGHRSELHLVEGFADFDEDELNRELNAIWEPVYLGTNYLATPEQYGIFDGSRLQHPGRYFYDKSWWDTDQKADTKPMRPPQSMIDAIREVYGLTPDPWFTLQESVRQPRFYGWARVPEGCINLFIWGWTSVDRMYANFGMPVEFRLERGTRRVPQEEPGVGVRELNVFTAEYDCITTDVPRCVRVDATHEIVLAEYQITSPITDHLPFGLVLANNGGLHPWASRFHDRFGVDKSLFNGEVPSRISVKLVVED